MAITKSAPTIKVQVVTSNTPLEEYPDPDLPDTESHIVRFIEATSNANFEVHCTVQPRTPIQGNAIDFQISVDSDWIDSRFIEPKWDRSLTSMSVGLEYGDGMLRRYKFAALDIGEDGKSKEERVGDLGTIQVELYHVRKFGPQKSAAHLIDTTREVGQLSEKVLKGQAVSHSVGFADAEKMNIAPRMICDAEDIDPEGKPFAIYEFRYRSREALKSMLIIPRTPSPEHEAEEMADEIEDLSKEELRELVRRSQSGRAEASIKREARDQGPRRRKLPARKGEILTIELDDDGEIISETTTRVADSNNEDDSILID